MLVFLPSIDIDRVCLSFTPTNSKQVHQPLCQQDCSFITYFLFAILPLIRTSYNLHLLAGASVEDEKCVFSYYLEAGAVFIFMGFICQRDMLKFNFRVKYICTPVKGKLFVCCYMTKSPSFIWA